MSDSTMVTQPQLDREVELDALALRVEQALLRATKSGATAAEASTHTSQGLSVSVRQGQVDKLEHMQDRGISVSVLIGRRSGHAHSADLSHETIEACVDKALEIARYTQEDPCNGLADTDLLATEFPDLDLWHPSNMDAQAAIDRALACEAAGRENPGITNSEGAFFDAGLGLSVYGNTNGFIGRSGGTRYNQSCVLIAGEDAGMQRDYSFDSRRKLAELEPAEQTGRMAAERTVRRLGARQLPTGQMPVIFAPEVAKGFVGHLIGALSGSALYRNASFLKDTAGQSIFPDWLSLTERPHLRGAAGSASFDGEGVATSQRDIIQQGVLQAYILSSYSARRLGLQTTANCGGVRNLLLQASAAEGQNLIHQLEDGFYVTEVMGQGVSLVTGDYSRGAAGFKVENGELAFPVEEVTIAGNLRDMFLGIVATGSDIDTRGNIQTGSVQIASMTVAGL
jgi:PmbA protein